jgi:ribonuclease R
MSKRKNRGKGRKLSTRDLKKEVLKIFRAQRKKQLNAKQVISRIKADNNRDSVDHALRVLAEEGLLKDTGNYRYRFNRDADDGGRSGDKTYVGRADLTNSGAAYIIVDELEEDVFVNQKYVNTAQQGDIVRITAWRPRGRRKMEGRITEIIERKTEHFVGTLNIFNNFGVVAVDGKTALDIMVELDQLNGAKSGEMVVVKVTDWKGSRFANAIGTITTVLGKAGTSDIEMKAILINNGFDIEFPKDVLLEAEALPSKISPQEIHRRRDFRDTTTFTIDPTDAKDFDDALSIRTLDNGRLEIGVHIADVTHYVRPGSALDREALKRSTSVYLVDRVCPMLPERISNDLCSLRPNEDRLCFTALFELDPNNYRVLKRWFGKGVIHSDRRFNYGEAQEIIDSGKGDFAEELRMLNKVAHKLRQRRFKAGSIDFDSDEVRFRLDENGKPIEVYVKERMDTNLLIEDFMLLANKEVATYIVKKEERLKTKIPYVYRVHDEPDPDRVAELARFAEQLGIDLDISNPKAIARSYNKMMGEIKGEPGLKMLAPIAIRTMAKAEYTIENIGHYGLGFDNYTHFTSPIRRYADVLVHRLLEANLAKGSLYKANPKKLEEDCQHISRQERQAVTAERESIKYKQVEFIQDHVGEEFPGIINGIAEFGVFVELQESRCEGMISFDHMDEPYDIGPGRLSLKGKKSGKVLKMGHLVRVKILDAELERRRIEMALVGVPEQPGQKKSQQGSQQNASQNAAKKGKRSGQKRSGGKGRSKSSNRKRSKSKS